MRISGYKEIISVIIGIVVMATTSLPANGAEELHILGEKESLELIEEITNDYTKWETTELSGSLHLPQLPISPSLKIFMRKGKELFITVRVPLMGEVARVEADTDSILIVNKLKKTYCKESLEGLTRISTVSISDIQDIILGRMFIAGRGTLNKEMLPYIDIYSVEEEGGWIVVAKRESAENLIDYGFVVNPDKRLENITVRPEHTDSFGEISYDWLKKSVDVEFTLKMNGKTMGMDLSLNEPKWNVKPFERMEFNSKYRRLGIREFIKSM